MKLNNVNALRHNLLADPSLLAETVLKNLVQRFEWE
jgi:hypothetical protein